MKRLSSEFIKYVSINDLMVSQLAKLSVCLTICII